MARVLAGASAEGKLFRIETRGSDFKLNAVVASIESHQTTGDRRNDLLLCPGACNIGQAASSGKQSHAVRCGARAQRRGVCSWSRLQTGLHTVCRRGTASRFGPGNGFGGASCARSLALEEKAERQRSRNPLAPRTPAEATSG